MSVICVTQKSAVQGDFLGRIEEILKAKPYALILREKELSEEDYRVLAHNVHALCLQYEVPLFLNANLEYTLPLAKKLACGVHTSFSNFKGILENYKSVFGERESFADGNIAKENSVQKNITKKNVSQKSIIEDRFAQETVGTEKSAEDELVDADYHVKIGVSIHSVDEAIFIAENYHLCTPCEKTYSASACDGAGQSSSCCLSSCLASSLANCPSSSLPTHLALSHVIAGHIFSTDCKKGLEPRGLDFLQSIVDSIPSTLSLFAIGGINPERMPALLKTGVKGAAVMSSLMTCKNPTALMKELHK